MHSTTTIPTFVHCNQVLSFILLINNEEMNEENIKSQMRKGFLEYCILLILKKKSAYASDIIFELKEAKLIVVEGTMYPLLTRLKNNGLLDYRWEESTQGPPRKYYEVTEKGDLFLNELDTVWNDLNNVIHNLKSEK